MENNTTLELQRTLFRDVEGDSTLYAGMLAYLGSRRADEYVHNCVATDGSIWRNPSAARSYELTDLPYVNSSSRDMLMGVLLTSSPLLSLAAIDYLRENKNLLCPKASDNRNKVGLVGIAQLVLTAGGVSAFRHVGLYYALVYLLLRPLLGPLALIEAATVYKGYQVNLIYCALMLYRRHGIAKFWDKLTVRFLKNVRQMPDLVCSYLNGEMEVLREEVPHMWNRHQKAVERGHTLVSWPVDAWYYTREYPSEVYCMWVALATNPPVKGSFTA